ncbi:MAG TPA: type II toxin-antitoxin system VapC family toxin [Alphaproteobacteria bacterium]|nr:type II toxin-antitoxin system VapC family toxin [Alphaproteobacteria bacterium]
MATGGGEPVFVDTNVLIYANLARSPLHRVAQERLTALDEQGIDLWISRQVLREYLASMTRRDDLTADIPMASLVQDVRYFASRFHVAEDSPQVTEQLLTLLQQVSLGGKQIHDANIVATMQTYGIRQLLTHNIDDFRRFSGFISVLPLEARA